MKLETFPIAFERNSLGNLFGRIDCYSFANALVMKTKLLGTSFLHLSIKKDIN